jgi:hypothetical protein
MRNLAALGFVLAAALATPAFAQSFVGEWTATAHLEGGAEVSETLKVAKAGNGYTVTAQLAGAAPDAPQAGPGADVVLDGDKFSYTRSLPPDGAIKITYTGVVSGDRFTGVADVAGMQVPYTGVRVGAGK